MSDCFYEPLDRGAGGDSRRWRATAHTTGPWDPRSQHAGPPSALLARAAERTAPRDDVVVARVTVEVLGAVPVGELEVASRVVRPGRSVELVEAVLSAGGRDVARAAVWRVRRTEGASVPPRTLAPPPPDDLPAQRALPPGWVDGYLSAVEWRLVAGGFVEPGPCTA